MIGPIAALLYGIASYLVADQPQREPIDIDLCQAASFDFPYASVGRASRSSVRTCPVVGPHCARIEDRKMKRFTPARCAAWARPIVASVLNMRQSSSGQPDIAPAIPAE